MTRRDFMEKWFIYGMALFPIWLLDCYFFSRYPIYGVTPILLPLTVAAVATMEGQMAGGGFGMWVGFVWETTYPSGTGLMILTLTLCGFLAGTGVQYVLKRGFFGFFLCACMILCVVETILVLVWLMLGKATAVMLIPFAGKEILLTLLFTPVVYWVFQQVPARKNKHKRG